MTWSTVQLQLKPYLDPNNDLGTGSPERENQKSLRELQTEKVTQLSNKIHQRMDNYQKSVLMPKIRQMKDSIDKEER